MRIHYFQHDHFEDLGYIGDWAKSQNFTTSVTRFDINPELPSFDDFDWLIILGGKMSVNDLDKFPWLSQEIAFIQESMQIGKKVIGICLGSQLIARAAGANIYRNTKPEIGFWPVKTTKESLNDPVFRHLPSELTVMHMHFDISDLPKGAQLMASSEVTPCQAFRLGKNVFAFQFHFEISEVNAPGFIREVTPEIIPGEYVQQPSEMLRNKNLCILNNQVFSKMLDSIVLLSSD